MSSEVIYPAWGKTERLAKVHMVITEKLDGTNGLIEVTADGCTRAGSRNRWLNPDVPKEDNYGFGAWVREHHEELLKLGPGLHYGEWWGRGIGRNYGLPDRRFSLFAHWLDAATLPSCVSQVPVLYSGALDLKAPDACLTQLRCDGSVAAPGFTQPEGVIVWLGRVRYKRTFDDGPKGAGHE